MGVGAISSISSAASYNPYVYNTNSVSSASLNKIGAIPNDATKGGIDYTGLVGKTDQAQNINSLKPGESKNFADILMSQLSASSFKQAELLATNPKTATSADTASDAAVAVTA